MVRIGGTRFLVIGRAGMDLYADPPGTRIEDATRFTSALGGSSANIAVALVRQGCTAAILTRVSDDAVGRFVCAQLDVYGVDRSLVGVAADSARTSLAVVETRAEDCESVIYRNDAADFAMTVPDVERVDFAAFDAVVLTGTALAAVPSRGAAFRALDMARAAGVTVVFDIDHRPYSWPSASAARETCLRAAELSDIVVGNDAEFGVLAGDHAAGLETAQGLAQTRIAVYKRGPLGAITFRGDTRLDTGIYPTVPLKPTGAGDAFMGGFLAALGRGADLRDAVLRGSAAAALVVARVGCAPAMPDRETLDAFVAEHPAP